MKTIAPAAMAAIEAGEAIVSGAVEILPVTTTVAPGSFTAGDAVDLSWWQATFEQTLNDQARMGIGFRDGTGAAIGGITWAAMIDTVPSSVFQQRTLAAVVPAGCVAIRLYQEMLRQSGANNDGYIDSIALNVGGNAVTINNRGAEAGNTGGWSNEVGALGVRNADPAPQAGDYYFTGGVTENTRAFQDVSPAGIVTYGDGAAIRVWGGYGLLEIGGESFTGIGSRGLAQQNAGAVGGVAQGLTLSLSGLEAAVLELLDGDEIKRAAVVLYRLIFASDGKTLLDAHVWDRGRVDTVSTDEEIGGPAAIQVAVESAARGLGRAGGRRRSDSDQRLIDQADGYFKHAAYAGQKTLYWGGKKPSFGGAGTTTSGGAAPIAGRV